MMLSGTTTVHAEGNMLGLSLLSEQAKQELLDFYQFLLDRYGAKQSDAARLPASFYHPMKVAAYHYFDREEIYNER